MHSLILLAISQGCVHQVHGEEIVFFVATTCLLRTALGYCVWLFFQSYSILYIPCTCSRRIAMITRLFSQVSRYFTVMFNKFNHLIVSSWFLADIFLTGNNTDSCSYDLLVSNGASSSWHQILLILPFHWEIDQHFYWSIHILPEIVLFILGISKIDFLLFVSCSCSLQE